MNPAICCHRSVWLSGWRISLSNKMYFLRCVSFVCLSTCAYSHRSVYTPRLYIQHIHLICATLNFNKLMCWRHPVCGNFCLSEMKMFSEMLMFYCPFGISQLLAWSRWLCWERVVLFLLSFTLRQKVEATLLWSNVENIWSQERRCHIHMCSQAVPEASGCEGNSCRVIGQFLGCSAL